jgi:hypothetical protein
VDDARDSVEAIVKGLVERAELGAAITCGLRIDMDDGAVARVQLEVGALEFIEALRKEAGADEKNQRERRL